MDPRLTSGGSPVFGLDPAPYSLCAGLGSISASAAPSNAYTLGVARQLHAPRKIGARRYAPLPRRPAAHLPARPDP